LTRAEHNIVFGGLFDCVSGAAPVAGYRNGTRHE